MTDNFEALNIAPALLAGVEAMGWDAPTGLQHDAMAVIRRGNNVVLNGSPGSGAVGAYGLGILDRLLGPEIEPGDPAALVLVADGETASATADSLARMAAHTDLAVRAIGAGWATGPAHVLVAAADAALAAVHTSALKLESIQALIIDGAELLVGTHQWADLETLTEAVPGAAQRVLVTGRFDPAIETFIEGHVRKAMTVPPRSEPGKPVEGAAVRYAVVPETGKAAAAVQLLADPDADQLAVVCRTADRAAAVRRTLVARGVTDDDDARLLVLHRTEADTRSVQAAVLSFDVPFDADELTALHGDGGAVLVTPRERAHLLRIAARARLKVEAVSTAGPRHTGVDALRDRLRELTQGDLSPEMALLEPLLAELPAVELAAAAIRLGRDTSARETTGSGTNPPAQASPSSPGRAGAAPPPEAGTWTHLFVSIGHRDDVGPGDLVGAITGEADISGDQIGKIDIRESHSTVEVETPVAARVIEALNGRSLKGRSLRVDYDRKDRGGSAGRSGRAGGARPGPRGRK